MTTHPATGTDLVTSYTLDGNGNTTTRTTADNVVTTYGYDAVSRLISVAATGLSTIGYAYDETSLRTSMSDGTGTTTYAYDGLSRLTQAVQPNGTLSYGYDLDSNRTSLTYPGPSTVTYSYSNAGRLSSLQDWATRTTSYTYTAAGLAKTVTLPNGLLTTYSYDRAQRLTNLTNVVGSTNITTHSYTLDNEGNRTAQSEFVSGITGPGQSETFGYTYDGLNRLTAVTTTNAEGFTLDAASNIASRTGPSATYTYDTANRLTGDGSQTFAWSDADRLAARGSDTFGYDPLDRLTSSTVSGTSRTYAYNGDGLLQTRTQGSTTSFLWDPATSPSRLLLHGSDKLVYGLGPLYVAKADGTSVTFARDGGKSVRAELNGSGSVMSSWRYRAYGEIVQYTGSATPSFLGYAGQLLDPSGLYYMRARWYDAQGARFVTHDPLPGSAGLPVSLNSYGYGGANPVLMLDPTGLAFTTGFDEGGACVDVSACLEDTAAEDEWKDANVGCFDRVICHTSPVPSSGQTFVVPAATTSGATVLLLDDSNRATTNSQASAAGGPPSSGSRRRLYRLGEEPESAARLGAEAARAKAGGFPHGVSVRSHTSRLDARSALWSEVERYFRVIKTGKDPAHYTVELPEPVTGKVAWQFNDLFRR
jgi:RHS repeat-associated protein